MLARSSAAAEAATARESRGAEAARDGDGSADDDEPRRRESLKQRALQKLERARSFTKGGGNTGDGADAAADADIGLSPIKRAAQAAAKAVGRGGKENAQADATGSASTYAAAAKATSGGRGGDDGANAIDGCEPDIDGKVRGWRCRAKAVVRPLVVERQE